MLIRTVTFVGSVVSPDQPYPGTLPQIAFAGRSNVGKSSLINRVLGRPHQKPARVSATPGKTQALNFFEVNESFYLVDLPGSGYAHAPQSVRDSWKELVERFIQESSHLLGVVYLVDARHPPSSGDREFMDFLSRTGTPTLAALTKVDKLKTRQREQIGTRVVEPLMLTEDQVVLTSSKTGEGAAELIEAMGSLLEGDEDREIAPPA